MSHPARARPRGRGLGSRALVGTGLATAVALWCPAGASAHGLVGKQDLPIPAWLFTWAAAVVLVASFVALTVLWQQPRLERTAAGRQLLTLPRAAVILASAVGVALLALTIYSGYAGTSTPTANFAPTFVSVLFWVGAPCLSLIAADWFRAFNPWRAIGRLAGWLVGRAGGGSAPEPLDYPAWLGRWPAAITILLFAWFELVYSGFERPADVATAAALYTGVQLLGMSLCGVDAWTENAEGFGVYFGLVASIGPLVWRGRRLQTRPWLSGTTAVVAVPGTVALVAALIGTTSFDGFSQGPLWNSLAPGLQDRLEDIGLSPLSALRVAFTVGLIALVGVAGGLYRIGAAGMRSVDGSKSAGLLSRRFVHSLLPIALAYVVAHYFSYLFVQGQAVAYLASDPLGNGANLLGTASATIDYNLFSPNVIWIVQVLALLAGHVGGLIIAHDRALITWRVPRQAVRSQYWMLTVMVSFTCLGLWLLSAQQ